MKANILVTEYEIKKVEYEDDYLNDTKSIGCCDLKNKNIIILNIENDERYKYDDDYSKQMTIKEILRHEILHAFLFESGLNDSSLILDSAWARNEEMIDWFAIQSPKIYKVYKDLDLL